MKKSLLIVVATMLLGLACDQFSNVEIGLDENFVRIYNVNANLSFQSLAMQELPNDEGYLLLGAQLMQTSASESGAWTPYLLQVDIYGDYVWDTLLVEFTYDPDQLGKALVPVAGKYYFNATGESGTYVLMAFSPETREVEMAHIIFRQTNYLALSAGPDESLLLAYTQNCNVFPEGVVFRCVETDGSVRWSTLIPTETGQPQNLCFNFRYEQITQTGYYESSSGTRYCYVKLFDGFNASSPNAWYSLYRFSENGEMLDRVPYMAMNQLPDYPDGLRSMPLLVLQGEDDSLRMASANFTSNEADVLIPQIVLNFQRDTLSTRDNGFTSHEYSFDAPMLIRKIPDGEEEFLLYVGTTWSGQVLMTLFDERTGEVINKRYLGYKLYYEVDDWILTSDGGYAVYGHTLTAGRFQQLFLMKFSADQLEDFLFERI